LYFCVEAQPGRSLSGESSQLNNYMLVLLYKI